MTNLYPVRRALISVSDKTGLIDLAKALSAGGIEILSTGGSAPTLPQNPLFRTRGWNPKQYQRPERDSDIFPERRQAVPSAKHSAAAGTKLGFQNYNVD